MAKEIIYMHSYDFAFKKRDVAKLKSYLKTLYPGTKISIVPFEMRYDHAEDLIDELIIAKYGVDWETDGVDHTHEFIIAGDIPLEVSTKMIGHKSKVGIDIPVRSIENIRDHCGKLLCHYLSLYTFHS